MFTKSGYKIGLKAHKLGLSYAYDHVLLAELAWENGS